MKTVLAIRHLAFEDLGTFGEAFAARGFAISYFEAGVDDFATLDAAAPDVMVVLGGPIGVYEDAAYPFLREELDLVRRRLASGKRLLGLCLGAQIIAAAAGARVYPTGIKEIGYGPVELTEAGRCSALAPLADDPVTLHWHGDTFDLPAGAVHLARTDKAENQAFAIGEAVLGLQFHPEADGRRIEQWLIGHTGELNAAGIDIAGLRADAVRHGEGMRRSADAIVGRWLATG